MFIVRLFGSRPLWGWGNGNESDLVPALKELPV